MTVHVSLVRRIASACGAAPSPSRATLFQRPLRLARRILRFGWRASPALGLLAAALAASPASFADDSPTEPDLPALRHGLEQAFAAAERDHAKVRARDFADKLGDFPERLRGPLAAARSAKRASVAESVEKVLAEVRRGGALPLSVPTLRVVLVKLLPADAAIRDELTADRCRDEFLAAVRDVFSAERFEDCWDASFGGLQEVVAWRAAHAPKPEPPKPEPPAKPTPETPPVESGGAGTATPPTGPEGVVAPEPPKEPEIPSPFATDPTVNLIPLDRGRGWVGPWTGWTQDIAERDNKRQRRPAKAVYVDRYEVTCAEYLQFLRAADAGKRRNLLPVGWTLDDALEPACPPGRERCPVTGVSYVQALEYAAAAGKRLPTEDEWDRAAGGGEKEPRPFPWGASPAGHRFAFGGEGCDAPVAVDAYPDDRTPDGIVGLAGNVAEIVATLPDRRDVPSKVNADVQVVIRGGSWRSPRDSECATTYRWVVGAEQGSTNVGFRCVMDEAEYRKRFR